MSDPVAADTQRWLASMAARRPRGRTRPKVLAPWDEMGYFDLPITSVVNMVAGQVVPLCLAEPRRVVLCFSSQSSAQVYLTPNGNEPMSQGILLTGTTLPFFLYQAEHGVLAQSAWFASAPVLPASVYVIQITLHQWGE